MIFLSRPVSGLRLRPRLRGFLGIRELDSGGLEALLVKNIWAFSQLDLTPPERDAFLLTNLPDALLRRLPIYVRSDGEVGDAQNAFVEGSWRIPASLRGACSHCATIVGPGRPGTSAAHSDSVDTGQPDRDGIVRCRSSSLALRDP